MYSTWVNGNVFSISNHDAHIYLMTIFHILLHSLEKRNKHLRNTKEKWMLTDSTQITKNKI
jgi:hypothetical protein